MITFSLTHIVPGDPARLQAGPHATARRRSSSCATSTATTSRCCSQYVTYMGDLLHGNLGESITTRRPVSDDLRQFFPATVELTVAAMLIVVLVGLPLGTARRPAAGAARPTTAAALFSIAAVSMPVFWLGIILQIIFYQKAEHPAGGRAHRPGAAAADPHHRPVRDRRAVERRHSWRCARRSAT